MDHRDHPKSHLLIRMQKAWVESLYILRMGVYYVPCVQNWGLPAVMPVLGYDPPMIHTCVFGDLWQPSTMTV